MSAKLIATQVTAVTLGVVGAALIERAIDKGTRVNPVKRGVIFEKLSRFQGELPIIDEVRPLVVNSIEKPVVVSRPEMVFDDNFANEAEYYY